MNESMDDAPNERHVAFISGNVRLDIVVTQMGEKEWSLSVINERGIFSTWWEYFECPDTAIRTALNEIQEENIEEFTNIEGFEYLDERHEDV